MKDDCKLELKDFLSAAGAGANIHLLRREATAKRRDQSTFPVDLAVSEFKDKNVRLFTGIIRDITERQTLERQVLDISDQEQRRLGQDLHDSVGQDLTGLGLMAEVLVETLADRSPADVAAAEKIAQGLKRALSQVRVLAKGLTPVDVDAEGFTAALRDLANRITQQGNATCVFECPKPVSIHDNFVARHLYRIAQEAVTNALKHSGAKMVRIRLETRSRHWILRISDDGRGMADSSTRHDGVGLKIMRYRASLINAVMTIESVDGKGLAVTCRLPALEKAHEDES
jgi:signal transduction histidine kinase